MTLDELLLLRLCYELNKQSVRKNTSRRSNLQAKLEAIIPEFSDFVVIANYLSKLT